MLRKSPTYSTIEYYFADFRRNHTSKNAVSHSGRPQKAVRAGNMMNFLGERKIKFSVIVDITGSAKEG